MSNKIKNKTKLRKLLISKRGNSGELDYIEFFHDFTWKVAKKCKKIDIPIYKKLVSDFYKSVHTPALGDYIQSNISNNLKRVELIIEHRNKYGVNVPETKQND